MEYVGLENITFALEDPLMWTSLENTIWLTGSVRGPTASCCYSPGLPYQRVFGEISGSYDWRLFVPYITSTVAISIMFTTLFSKDYGAVNAALQSLASWEPLALILPRRISTG